jgi:TolA-binding protein
MRIMLRKKQFVTDLYLKNDKKDRRVKCIPSSYPKSNLRDDAMYELANTYVAASKQDLGLKTHDRLINEYPKGSYTQKHYCDKD